MSSPSPSPRLPFARRLIKIFSPLAITTAARTEPVRVASRKAAAARLIRINYENAVVHRDNVGHEAAIWADLRPSRGPRQSCYRERQINESRSARRKTDATARGEVSGRALCSFVVLERCDSADSSGPIRAKLAIRPSNVYGRASSLENPSASLSGEVLLLAALTGTHLRVEPLPLAFASTNGS